MKCSRCGAENREGSNFCRYCSTPLPTEEEPGASGYVPSVPPPDAASYGSYNPPADYQQPQPQMMPVAGQIMCPRCGSTSVIKGGIPPWAIILAVVGFLVVCIFSLFFLLIKEPNRCLNCGLEFK